MEGRTTTDLERGIRKTYKEGELEFPWGVEETQAEGGFRGVKIWSMSPPWKEGILHEENKILYIIRGLGLEKKKKKEWR
jgi:hypothetical protein